MIMRVGIENAVNVYSAHVCVVFLLEDSSNVSVLLSYGHIRTCGAVTLLPEKLTQYLNARVLK